MRQRQYTLTPAHVHAHVSARMQQYLRLADHGPRCRADTLWAVLCYAASRIISLAAACAALRDAPSDTAAHDALLATLPDYAELQRRLNRALQGDLPHALRRRRQPLAIDLVLIPYHGRPLHHANEVYRSQAKSGHQPLPRLRHRLRHPEGPTLHRCPHPGGPPRRHAGGAQAAAA